MQLLVLDAAIESAWFCNAEQGLARLVERSFLAGFFLSDLFASLDLALGLETHLASTPLVDTGEVVVVQGSAQFLDAGERLLVLGAHAGDGEAGGSLLVNDLAEGGLALDDAVRHVHLAAQGREPHNELDGVNVVSDDDELGELLFDEVGNVVETELDDLLLLGSGDLLLLSDSLW